MFWIKEAVLSTPHKHTDVMRLLQDSFKGIYRKPGNYRPLEGYTTHKKFEVKIRSWPLSRNEHPYAMGLVEEDGSGSLIRLKMWMDPFVLIFIGGFNLVVFSIFIYSQFESFEWEKFAALLLMIFPTGVFFVFYLFFAYEFRILRRNLCSILDAVNVKP
jgi:hypothetical protein